MEANNLSRKMAKDLAEDLGWEKQRQGNFFVTKQGELVNITLTTKNKVESRQFREDCDYLLSYNYNKNSLSLHKKKDLEIGNVTRVSAKGVRYYQANLKD